MTDVKWAIVRHRVTFLHRFLRLLRENIFSCSCDKRRPSKYHSLPRSFSANSAVNEPAGVSSSPVAVPLTRTGDESDIVPIKISLLGDCKIGKTSFMMKYVGEGEEELKGLQTGGLNLMDKTFCVTGARIMHSIWDVEGEEMEQAIPVLIGTKFDDFIQLPVDIQGTIVNQARAFARAMRATLFFSSTAHNINVNKIFKFITAKIFNLPWTVERNLTLGEPTIDF